MHLEIKNLEKEKNTMNLVNGVAVFVYMYILYISNELFALP